ncbi:MAG: 3-isopropylmalate dehydratase large subunit [Maricaulaceae bacterium]|jgi:3-isopropylmalate/(R)-2-methylmalate dehydratase large subunit
MAAPKTLFEKVWESHLVSQASTDQPAVLYIDLHLIHEVTTPQAFAELKARGLKVRRPNLTLATCDHSTPTLPAGPDGFRPYATKQAQNQVETLYANCKEHGITLHGWESEHRGIVHVMGPELGATQPGMTIVCGDSHTSTHGAFGALAFGIGTTEVGHVLATQCVLQRRPKTLAIEVESEIPKGVTAKDLILAIIGKIGVGGGVGHVIEYRGPGIAALSMEERMTICNMSIEGGARAGMIAPDETTFAWLEGRERAPKGADFDAAIERWRALTTDDGAEFDQTVTLDAAALAPMITWGNNPAMSTQIDAAVPEPAGADERRALEYMGLSAGRPIAGLPVQKTFVGSCTNGRLSDLEAAAAVMKGRKVADNVEAIIVPGSETVKRQAEAAGLHEVFLAAGAQWREPGCSMCLGMNGDTARPGEYVVSTSNRNFEGRQGPGARTMLASPATAAASAIAGCVADARAFLAEVGNA